MLGAKNGEDVVMQVSADAEIKQYLRLMLDHSSECPDESCPSEALLHEICGIIRERIFPELTLAESAPRLVKIERKKARVDTAAVQG